MRVIWMKIEFAAIIDGCSRKIGGTRALVYHPTTADMLKLIEESIGPSTDPRIIITDRGSQFQCAFHSEISRRGTMHVQGLDRTWQYYANF